ncbi:MAG: hypothetical protein Q7U66_11265, partial [Methylobacter sp.]|nr:hypothetical protein [Methylobacter sp.]
EAIVHVFSRSVFLRSENAGFTKSRRVIARMMLDIPLLGIQRMKQDGCGSRRHKRSRDFCRLLGRDAHKSFRKNSDSPVYCGREFIRAFYPLSRE